MEKDKYIIKMKQQAVNDDDAIKAIEISIDVVHKFDGKVLNARLFNAINDALYNHFTPNGVERGRVSVSNSAYSLKIYARKNDWFCCGEPNQWDNRDGGYVDYQYYMNVGGKPNVETDSDNRIKAAETIANWTQAKVHIIERKNHYLAELDKIDDIESEYAEIMKSIVAFNKKHSRDIRSIYKLKEC